MKVALYARISTSLKRERQDPETQLFALRQLCTKRGWEISREYIDDISAVKKRPQYEQMLADARQGHAFDAIVVVRLDRIFRSLAEFVTVLRRLNQWNIRFLCTHQPIDTDRNDPAGQLLMNIVAAVAEFERGLISERVKAGIQRARAQGKHWRVGRKPKVVNVGEVLRLKRKGLSLSKISLLVGCNRNLLSRTLRKKKHSAADATKREDAQP